MNTITKVQHLVWLLATVSLHAGCCTSCTSCSTPCCTGGGTSETCSQCCCCCQKCNFCTWGKTWFSQRDQGSAEYWVMSLTADKRHLYDQENFYGDLAVTAGWQQNEEQFRLSSYFLDRNGLLNIGANSTVADPHEDIDIRASDLGLSTTFSGCAWLCPHYADFIADFDLYVGWDRVAQGLWTELRAPLIYTRWNPMLKSITYTPGSALYCSPDGDCDFFDNRTIGGGDDQVVFRGECAINNALKGDCGFGDAPCLHAGKIDACAHTAWGLAGIRFALGYDFLRRERGSCGIAVDAEFPVANKPCSCQNTLYLFDANIGSQHCWKVGGVARGQCMLWSHDEKDRRIDLYIDTRAHAVFSGKTTRLLGILAGGSTLFNQYLLEKKYTIEGDEIVYQGLERAANVMKNQIYVKPLVEGQITLMVQYQHHCLLGAAGYNFFGRGAETLCSCCCASNECAPQYYYVIKGTASVGPDAENDGGFYNKTDSNIRKTGTLLSATKANLEKAAFTACETDYCTAAHPACYSHTFFGNIGYQWQQVRAQPYLGVIGKIEIGLNNTALRMWGVALKGGVCF